MLATHYRKIRVSYPNLPHPLMQGSYYDRFIRDDDELFVLRKYIQGNPIALKLKRDGYIK